MKTTGTVTFDTVELYFEKPIPRKLRTGRWDPASIIIELSVFLLNKQVMLGRVTMFTTQLDPAKVI